MNKTRYFQALVLIIFLFFCIIPAMADTSTQYWAPWVTKTNTTSATINWHGESDGSGSIDYATSEYYEDHQHFDKTITSGETGIYQHVQLTGLEPNTAYIYLVKPSGNQGVFGNRMFQTMPVSGPFTFIVISDSQEGDNYTEWMRFKYVAEAIANESDVLFILHGGDYAGHDSGDLWNTYFQVADPMLAKFAIFTTIGNHEYHNGSGNTPTDAYQYHSSYEAPLNYSFDCADVRFVVLDSPDPNNANGDDPHTSLALATSQEAWLEEQLDNDQSGTFTIHHHPIWDYYSNTSNPNLQPWETLYHTYNISATFAGHTHNYQRYSVMGIPYFIVGDAGGQCADLVSNNTPPVWYQTGETRVLGYLKVAVDPEHNTATAQEIIIASVKEDDDNETPYVYPQPEVIDSFTFPLKINPSPPDPPGTPITAPAVISSPGHYRLINDLSNSSAETAILITASDVVLDGNGHTLEGNGSPETSGVSIRGGSAGGSNVTVQGLTMSGWSRGIGVENQTGGVINTCNPTRNVFGIYVENSRGVQVTGVNASGNIPVNGGGGTGISIIESPGCVVTCSTASQNGWTAPLDIGGYGILLDSSPGTVISSCTMNGNRNTAIEDLSGPAGLLLEDNVISGNGGNGGIFFSTLRTIRTQNCTISRNRISGNGMGIGIDQADNCVMEQNQVTGGGNGIVLSSSRNATLAGNVMAGNIVNFQVTGTGEQYYQHVIGTSNTVNGKPVMYLFNQPGALVDAGSRAGTVYGIASPGITVRDLVLMNSSSGVFLLNSDNAVVQNVTALGNLIGISMNGCDNLTITGSTASGNDLAGCDIQDSDGGTFESVTADNTIDPHPDTGAGISIETSRDIHIANATTRMNKFAGIWVSDSDGIRITQATISGNGDAGIVITGDGTEVSGCRIVDNGQAGIGLLSAQRSRITNNWFSNKMNIYIGDDVAGTAWNTPKTLGTNIVNGPYLGGNYWANPEGTGFSQTHADRGDGFCNESYAINADNMDYLPLHTYSPKPTFYADFTVSPTSGMAPLTVKCTDKSVGNPTRYNYDFGDGVNVTGPNPTHTYRFPGTYSITLTITKYDKTTSSIIGTSTTKTNVISVGKVPFVMPVARFTASPVNGTVPLTVTFTDQSSGDPSFYNYDFGDGINATGKDQVHTYRYPGIYNVTLTVLKNDAANRMMVANSSVRTGLITVNGK